MNGAFLVGGPNALVDSSNIGQPGRWLFTVRSGVVTEPDSVAVPEPAGAMLFAGALLGLALLRRRALL